MCYHYERNSFAALKLSKILRISSLNVIVCTVCLQMNGAVSKVNKKFISHLTRAKRTPSAAATVQVSNAQPAVRFSCLLQGRGTSLQHGVIAGAHRKPFPAATPCCILAPRPRSKHEKRTAGSACETWTVAAADGVRFARVR